MTKQQKPHSINKSRRKTAGRESAASEETLRQPDNADRQAAASPSRSEAFDTDDAGQSGDTQGLPGTADADSQSVKELVEEGQDFEAMVISGVENAPDPDVESVKTREVPEDDVLPEYRDYRENK